MSFCYRNILTKQGFILTFFDITLVQNHTHKTTLKVMGYKKKKEDKQKQLKVEEKEKEKGEGREEEEEKQKMTMLNKMQEEEERKRWQQFRGG